MGITGRRELTSNPRFVAAAALLWIVVGLWLRARFILVGCEYNETANEITHGADTRGGWALLAYFLAASVLLVLALAELPPFDDRPHSRRIVLKLAMAAAVVVAVSVVPKWFGWQNLCSGM
jgi:hypothetical protein